MELVFFGAGQAWEDSSKYIKILHQRFRVPKMEVLYLIAGCFGDGFLLT